MFGNLFVVRVLIIQIITIFNCSSLGGADPTCKCPFGSKFDFYCGYELIELNEKASTKVDQRTCNPDNNYLCPLEGYGTFGSLKPCPRGTKCKRCSPIYENLAAKYNDRRFVDPTRIMCILNSGKRMFPFEHF